MSTTKPSRAQTPVIDPEARLLAPMFPYPDDNGKVVFADMLKTIKIFRQGANPEIKSRRAGLIDEDYETADGGVWEFNPFETDDRALGRQFGGGEYYVEPIGHDNRLLEGFKGIARVIFVSGPPRVTPAQRRRDAAEAAAKVAAREDEERAARHAREDRDEDRDDARGGGGASAPAVIDSMRSMYEEQIKTAKELAGERARQSESYAERVVSLVADSRGGRSDGVDAAVSALRAQIDTLNQSMREAEARATRAMDEERARHREEVARRDREVEELRHERRAAAQAAVAESDALRRRGEDERAELRRRYEAETDEQRKRLAAVEDDWRRRAERDVADVRQSLQARIGQLEKDATDLRAALVRSQAAELRTLRELSLTPPADELAAGQSANLANAIAAQAQAQQPARRGGVPDWLKDAAPVLIGLVDDLRKQAAAAPPPPPPDAQPQPQPQVQPYSAQPPYAPPAPPLYPAQAGYPPVAYPAGGYVPAPYPAWPTFGAPPAEAAPQYAAPPPPSPPPPPAPQTAYAVPFPAPGYVPAQPPVADATPSQPSPEPVARVVAPPPQLTYAGPMIQPAPGAQAPASEVAPRRMVLGATEVHAPPEPAPSRPSPTAQDRAAARRERLFATSEEDEVPFDGPGADRYDGRGDGAADAPLDDVFSDPDPTGAALPG